MEPKTELERIVKQLLSENNKTQKWLVDKMGLTSTGSFRNQLSRGNMNLDTFCRLCNAMDYEVTIQPKSRRGVRPASQIIVDLTDDSVGTKAIKVEDDGE